LVAANPIGDIATPNGHLWAAPFETDNEFGGAGVDTATRLARPHHSAKVAAMMAVSERANTTIAIVATDAPLTKAQCQRLAIASHDGIARAIVPAHSPMDGDLVFAVSMGGSDGPDPDLSALCHAASMCLTRAIGRAVVAAVPAPDDLLPCWTPPT
jgi:D-aminopeptidase